MSSFNMRGTKGARAGSALDTDLLCQRLRIMLALEILAMPEMGSMWGYTPAEGSSGSAGLGGGGSGSPAAAAQRSCVSAGYQQGQQQLPWVYLMRRIILRTQQQFSTVWGCLEHLLMTAGLMPAASTFQQEKLQTQVFSCREACSMKQHGGMHLSFPAQKKPPLPAGSNCWPAASSSAQRSCFGPWGS